MLNLAPKTKYNTIYGVPLLRLYASGRHVYYDKENWIWNTQYIQNDLNNGKARTY